MPLSTIASYISTCDLVTTHWAAANAAYGSSIELSGGFKSADLVAMRAALQTAITACEGPRNNVQNAGNDRDLKKAALIERLRQFRNQVSGLLAGSVYDQNAPAIPAFQSGEGVFMKQMDDMQTLWVQLNASPPAGFTPPLKLVGNYTAANHLTDLTALRTTYATLNAAMQTVELKLGARDALLPPMKARMVQYRKAIQGLFPAGDGMIASLPRITPLPGSTPRAVAFDATWNATAGETEGTWVASTDPELDHYELRASDGPTYKAAGASVVASYPPGTTTFTDTTLLLASGSSKVLKLFVVTHDGNEKGSRSVTVTRP